MRFVDILAWQKAKDIAVKIYGKFSTSKDFEFRDQITRATVAISNNIVEGFERRTNLDFKRFLYYALRSNSKLRSILYLSVRLNFMSKEESNVLIEDSNEISKMFYGLIKSMK